MNEGDEDERSWQYVRCSTFVALDSVLYLLVCLIEVSDVLRIAAQLSAATRRHSRDASLTVHPILGRPGQTSRLI